MLLVGGAAPNVEQALQKSEKINTFKPPFLKKNSYIAPILEIIHNSK